MKNQLFIITGNSGAGKNSTATALLKELPQLRQLITYTTRLPRGAEVNDVDYHFISQEQFEEKIKNNELLEYATVYDHYYGSSRTDLEKVWQEGKTPLMVIDIQGALTFKKLLQNVTTIFIKADNLENLQTRCRQRPMSDADFDKRWQKVLAEIELAKECDFVIINRQNELPETVNQAKKIILEASID